MNPLDLTLVPKTDPTDIYRYRDGLYAVDLLTTAIAWLDFFTWLSKNPSNKKAICSAFDIKERPADVMLTLFVAMGLVRSEQDIFQATELAEEHLVKGSPWYLAPYYASLKERPVCKDFLTVLRTGKPAAWGSLKDEKEWAKAMEQEGFASQFTAAMDCRGVYLGQALAKQVDCRNQKRLLDIAGGSGIYSCAIVAEHDHLQATVLEKPPVDRVARDAIAKRGCADRVSVQAGDMFAESLPLGYDLHLFSNVLHDWDEPLVRELLEKSFRALASGGLLIVHDAHINAAKSGPLPVAAYSVLLMHATEGKCYSVAEMERYLTDTGFTEIKYRPTAADRSIITAKKK